MSTDVGRFFEELDGGVFADKLGAALHDAAKGVVDYERAGKVTITLDIKRLGKGHQVTISHKLVAAMPTPRGKVTEEETTETPMHVGKNGVTFFPEDQYPMFDHRGKVPARSKEGQQEPGQ